MRNILIIILAFLSSCSISKKISQSAKTDILSNPILQTAHVGITLFEPATRKTWYDYQGDHYFVPASNTKIPTCYAAMKHLGDSLVGLRWGVPDEQRYQNAYLIKPTGDPTFLLDEFSKQPVRDFLQKNVGRPLLVLEPKNQFNGWGSGWSWSDYDAAYMAERSAFPVYGNLINIKLNDSSARTYIDTFLTPGKKRVGQVFKTQQPVFDQMVNLDLRRIDYTDARTGTIRLTREISGNGFTAFHSDKKFSELSVPFVPGFDITDSVIAGFTGHKMEIATLEKDGSYLLDGEYFDEFPRVKITHWNTIHSQPTDSLLKPMMHRSDNFFAEQSLLMVSNEMLGYMNDEKIIDTLLKTDFNDLPQKPRWADGSGLSRYNLFSPRDFVTILNKMKDDFGMDRIKTIFATGGEGTISSYYKADSGFIYGKTGTLSGVVAFSGFLYTKKGKLILFSTLVNNHTGSATDVRRAVEKFLESVRNAY